MVELHLKHRLWILAPAFLSAEELLSRLLELMNQHVHTWSAHLGVYGTVVVGMARKIYLLPPFSLTGLLRWSSHSFIDLRITKHHTFLGNKSKKWSTMQYHKKFEHCHLEPGKAVWDCDLSSKTQRFPFYGDCLNLAKSICSSAGFLGVNLFLSSLFFTWVGDF